MFMKNDINSIRFSLLAVALPWSTTYRLCNFIVTIGNLVHNFVFRKSNFNHFNILHLQHRCLVWQVVAITNLDKRNFSGIAPYFLNL